MVLKRFRMAEMIDASTGLNHDKYSYNLKGG